jgi:hypothetical protein
MLKNPLGRIILKSLLEKRLAMIIIISPTMGQKPDNILTPGASVYDVRTCLAR